VAELSLVVFSQGESFPRTVVRALEGADPARIAELVSQPERLAEAVRAHRPDALLVDLGAGGGSQPRLAPDAVLDLVEKLPAPAPSLLVAGPESESALVLRAMRLGAREFLPPQPGPEAIRKAVARLGAVSAPAAEEAPRAPVLAVLGAKGGVGTTVVTCQLAVALQRLGARCALVDLGFPTGDVAVQMNAHTRFTLADAVRDGGELDAAAVSALLHEHPTGVRVLASPARVEESELLEPRHVERVLQHLRESFDWVVIDLARSWNDCTRAAVEGASQLLLVTTPDVPTLSHARRRLEGLERIGHTGERVRLVVNRFASGGRDGAPRAGLPRDRVPGPRLVRQEAAGVRTPRRPRLPRAPDAGAQARRRRLRVSRARPRARRASRPRRGRACPR
jgi:pilus assembly protein CpaE